MSVATNDILKLLSDLSASADKIVEENAFEFKPRLSEWISLVENKGDRIVESESATETEEIPNLMSFLKGPRSEKGPRVSTVLTEMQRLHLHRKGKSSIKARKSRHSSIKTPSRRKSVKGPTYSENDSPKLKLPPTVIKKTGIVFTHNQNAFSSSTLSIQQKVETPATFTPADGKGTILMMDKSRERESSKRKSSSELPLKKENVKKPKRGSIDQLQRNDSRERDKSGQNSKMEKMKAKSSTLLPNYANIKSSVGSTNVSVLKENRTLRSKIDTKQDKAGENRKNLQALRQQKLEQNKKTREEKMEKTLQLRLKLEKQKMSKLRSGGPHEKTLTTPKAMQKIFAENETLGEASKKDSMKSKDKQTSVKKLQMNLKKMGSEWVLKSNEKTPVKKNQKHEMEKMLNTTYGVTGEQQPSTSKNKAKKVIIEGGAQTIPKGTKTVKPQTQLINSSTPVQKKGPESYAITPARSSFVSYDISEIRSDSEDEEQETNSKPIPSWATGVRLRNALLQQHHHPIDTDELFGNIVDLPDLAVIMGVKKKHYNKRTSSAVWNSSFSFS